jgi:hypothetical protein
MEGNANPEIASPVEGTWHAWIPDSGCGCRFCGADAHGETEDELAAKLAD